MLYCGKCGHLLENNPSICPQCGTKVLYQNVGPESLEQFYQHVASKRTKNLTGWLIAVCIISAVIDLIIAMTGYSLLGVPECIFFVAFAILLVKKKTYIIPLILTIYCVVCLVINIIEEGNPSGVVGIVIGIMLIIRLRRINDEYGSYTKTGIYPSEPI